MTARQERPLDQYGLFEVAALEEPWDYYRQLRERAPVYRDPQTGIVQVSTYALVHEVVRDHETYSNKFGMAMAASQMPRDVREVAREGYPPVDTMLTADPPEHKRFRGLVNKAFTPRRVKLLEKSITETADGLIDAFANRGEVEVVSEVAVPLPLSVIADQLGVSRADLPRFKSWTDGFTAQLSGMASGEDAVEAVRRIVEYQEYFAERLEECRTAPRDDRGGCRRKIRLCSPMDGQQRTERRGSHVRHHRRTVERIGRRVLSRISLIRPPADEEVPCGTREIRP